MHVNVQSKTYVTRDLVCHHHVAVTAVSLMASEDISTSIDNSKTCEGRFKVLWDGHKTRLP